MILAAQQQQQRGRHQAGPLSSSSSSVQGLPLRVTGRMSLLMVLPTLTSTRRG
jgi:hypothetical protein